MKIETRNKVIRYTDIACPMCSAGVGHQCEPGLNNVGPRKPHPERVDLMHAIKHGTRAPHIPTPLVMPSGPIDHRPVPDQQTMEALHEEALAMDIEFDCERAEEESRETPEMPEGNGWVFFNGPQTVYGPSGSEPIDTPPGWYSREQVVIEDVDSFAERHEFEMQIQHLQEELRTYRKLWRTYSINGDPLTTELFVQEVHFLAVNAMTVLEENKRLRRALQELLDK